jgi:hypothetical protein
MNYKDTILEKLDVSTFPKTIIESDGKPGGSCLFHRQWEWTMKNYVPLMPHCTICGGKIDPRLTAHHLCVARQKRGVPTPVLDNTPECGCMACVKAKKTA